MYLGRNMFFNVPQVSNNFRSVTHTTDLYNAPLLPLKQGEALI